MKNLFILFTLALLYNSAFAKIDTCKVFTGTISQIRALTSSNYTQAASTDYGTGNWYRDTIDVVSADNTATVLVDASGKRWKRIYSGPIYVNWYGAKGDGVTNDSLAIQSCFNDAKPFQTISFNSGTYNFTSVTISTTDFIITGNKAKLLGTINVGDNTARDYNSVITGLTFSTTGNAIQIKNCRKLEISGNVFNGCDKAIYVKPEGTAVHHNGLIEITKANFFNGVNYCFYVDRDPSATWQATNDCTFSGNVANDALITAVYCNGIDGLKYENNVIFFPSDAVRRVNKKHHLQIDNQSDWVIVNNNNFFESGEEPILVQNCKALNVTGNNFAWSGQKGVYSVVKATGTITDFIINVNGNAIDSFSGNVVEIDSTTYGAVNVAGNNINYANTFANYFGTQDLSLINHYIIKAGNSLTRLAEKNLFNNIINLKSTNKAAIVTKYDVMGSFGAESYVTRSVAFPDTNKVNVIGLYDAGLSSITYGGTINITVKNSSSSNANTSNYFLLVNKATSGSAQVAVVISSLGLLNGASANHPSFKFTIAGNRLYAQPINATRGTFYFFAKSDGNVIVTE
ncbi:glycosyl hydrolase family 28-related protein [Mucilaginibacter boryungensis]|uniref:Rhamnogalacturonase A/B/Epimerase-like pectate lyase domain-containing protein n=1 Tax=Mucilaginibacter boryungensis TaxID=768480 RepID=A0ABR9XJB7_9SPHI|nr:hypothetical protein [Mucilaginibacter boryungensis]MBE9667164.1 hypothetical protein [Mucilaginibacter boryungensis]